MTYRSVIAQYSGLALLLIVYTVLALFYSYAIPLGKSPDEFSHYLYARFIRENGRLPVTRAERAEAGIRANFPPLYHFPVASLMAATGKLFSLDPYQLPGNSPQLPVVFTPPEVFNESDVGLFPPLKTSWEPATRQLIDILLPRATLIRTEDEQPPYRGEYLAWFIGRWVSIILSAGTILLTYFSARVLFPQRPGLALTVAACLAFIPTFLFISAVMNDDNMVGITMASYLLLLVWFLRGQDSPWLYLGMGLFIGLATTAKYNGGLVVLSATLTIWLLHPHRTWSWRDVLWRIALVWLATGLAASWWFIWGEIHFNEIERYGLIPGGLKPFVPNTSIAQRVVTFVGDTVPDEIATDSYHFGEWIWRTFETTVALRIYGVKPYLAYWPIIIFFAGLTLISLVGLYFLFRIGRTFQKRWIIAFLVHFLFVLPLPVIRFFLTHRIHDTAQGRHILYPAAPVILILLIAGWDYWLKKPVYKKLAATIGVGALFMWAVGHAWYLWTAFPPPLPVRTTPGPQMIVAHDTSVVFTETSLGPDEAVDLAALTGYETHLSHGGSILELVLRWQSLGQTVEDYRTEISLVDTNGELQLRWMSHPADGRFPTRAWQPGDIVRDTLHIPLVGLSPGDYKVQLRLMGWDQPALSTQGEEVLHLTKITLEQPVQSTDVAIWQQGNVVSKQHGISLLSNPLTYRYRSTIPVTLSQPAPVSLIGPNGQSYSPVANHGHLYNFMVDYDWPSGDYTLYTDGVETDLKLDVENFDIRQNGWNFTSPEMMVIVNANFADQIKLLGYDLPTRRAEAGGGVPLVLYWLGLIQMREDYTMFVQLLDADLERRGGYDRFPRETYNTFLWVPGEVIDDGLALPIAPDAPNGIYTIRLGWYSELAGQANYLPILNPETGEFTELTAVTIGPIKVGGPPAGVTVEKATPQTLMNTSLAEKVELLGLDIKHQRDDEVSISADSALELTIYWQVLTEMDTDYTVFVHVRDDSGETVAQKDGPPSSVYPTSLWDAGEVIKNEVVVPLGQLEPGQYNVVMGMYDYQTGQRLVVPDSPNAEIDLPITVVVPFE